MRLDPFVRDYRKFMDDLVSVLESEQTRFFLDTSLLMWLVRLGSAARGEFFAWCRGCPANSVRVPVWAAHELHRHLLGSTVRTNFRATVSETERKLDEFVRLASERADEDLCRANGYLGRQGYISEVEQAFAKIKGLAKVVNSDASIGRAADEVIEFVNERILSTDVTTIVQKLGQIGEFRYSHLMPPGYHDKKAENKFGDVIIWEEMLEDIRVEDGESRRHGVLISGDEKTDWVSSAPLIKNGEKASQKSNRDLDLDVTRAHPLLVHEFEARARGGSLYVIPPGLLASALDYGSRRAGRALVVSNWLAAAHRPDLLAKLAGVELAKRVLTEAAPNPPRAVRATPATSASAGSAAVYSYPSLGELMRLPISEEVTAYLAASPLEQPALAQEWVSRLISGAFAPQHFGRIIAELCLRGRSEWLTQVPAIVEKLRTQISLEALNIFVLGAIAPAYFDRYGDPLRQPQRDLGATALLLEADSQLSSAFSILNGFLSGADLELPYIPGSGRKKVQMSIDANDQAGGLRPLRDIRIGGESVLADELAADSPRRLETLLGRQRLSGCTGQDLRVLLAREFLVPLDLLNTDYDTKRFTWLLDAGLVSLDTSSPGGLSANAADEENYRE